MNIDKLYEALKLKLTVLKIKIVEFLDSGFYRKPRFWGSVAIVFILLLLVKHCANTSNHNKRPGIPAVLAVAKTANIPIYLSALGTVTPINSVTVRTQINGQLLRVLFQEGQTVKTGDLLAEIDPRPYLAQLTQYEGQLARDTALLVNARLDLKRYQTLWRQESVAKQTLDTQTSLVNQYEGTVKIDQGLIENTKLNLVYTRITSPIDGRIGLRFVTPGNFVQTSDTTGIAIINSLNPIYVVFSLPEDDVSQVMDQINAKKVLTVLAYDRQQENLLDTGTLLTIDNQIDPTTGTVKLKAQFQNDANHLFPNQFVNVKLLVTTLNNVTVVPTAAIQHTTQGSVVYVVDADNIVTVKPVVTGVTTDDSTVIKSGVLPGQSVVIEGADKLADGDKVKVADTGPADSTPAKTKHNGHHRRSAT